ncbi:MAG: hypothetical protein JWR72_1018 [Flavisolibacter sp.]|nr:hypothetical protein [Flavisolibacter sp.]
MKRFFYCLLLIVSFSAHAQYSLYDSVNTRHNKISKTGTLLLSGWAAASLISGLVGQNNSTGKLKYFYKRNVLWGGINLGLSGLGYLRTKREQKDVYTSAQTFKRVEAAQKVFLFNTGLDLAYVAFGLYTRERSNKFTGDKKDRLVGTGNSLLFQGGFLTVFDGVLYLLHNKNGNRLEKKLEGLSFISSGDGVGLAYRF